ncbi:BON domain-containing protein [Hydrogenophaga sp.]|uniref:BON domain-containing protein n=1 Tax=Hydrogenophaga sp. TaxID=1904254 RepID=UPI00262D7D0A|nr:BON domain-containing protein [Hydrogenophaga sp.]MCW5655518.1 BON domain-containing protein [Hydrogenophaga sp.]
MKTQTTRYTALVAAAAATVLLAACGKTEDATVGQRLDSTVNEVQSAANTMKSDAQNAAQEMQAAGSQAGQAMAEGASDMAITAKVNAALAADDKLSALQIDVDTEAGRVALSGTAPDADSRERATTLASAVEGVKSVDNRLVVQKNS